MTPPELLPLLRLEVGRFRLEESRRAFAPRLQVGVLGAGRVGAGLPDLASTYDEGLRGDLARRLVEAAPDPRHAWLTRRGTPALHDLDQAWAAATARAFAAFELPLEGFFALTRAGWLDVTTGDSRTWRRLRL